MAGEDVAVTIGANATPYQVAMAKVKVTAKETAKSIGVEFDRGAQRAEMRVQRGMDGVIRSILKAKNPIEAISGALEGLSRAFAIASTALLAIGVVSALYEAFTEAKDASDKLIASMEKLANTDVNNESVHQLQRDIDDFQKVEEQYANRGLLEKILFGNKEDVDFAQAANLNGLKKDLVETRQLADDLTKAQARTLEASSNPEDQAKGKQMLKELSDKGENEDLQDKLEAAQKELFDAKQKANRQAFIVSSPTAQRTAEENKFLQENADIDLQGLIKAAQAKIKAIKQVQAAVKTAEGAEKAKPDKIGDEAAKRETDRILEEKKKQAKIISDSAEVGVTAEEKIAAQKQKISDQQAADSAEIGPKQESQALAEQNVILEEQTKLKGEIYDLNKQNAEKVAEANKSEAEKTLDALKEQVELRTQLLRLTQSGADSIKDLQAKIATEEKEAPAHARLQTRSQQIQEQNKITKDKIELIKLRKDESQSEVKQEGFHGPVTSLRKVGFGKIPGGANVSESQLKTQQESLRVLTTMQTNIAELNAKIGGGI